MSRTATGLTLSSLVAFALFAAEPSYAADCSDILANGAFDVTELRAGADVADSYVDYLLTHREFTNEMQSGSSGEVNIGFDGFTGGGGARQDSRTRQQWRDLLQGYSARDQRAITTLATIARTASPIIAGEWGRCMQRRGLNVSFRTMQNSVAVVFRYTKSLGNAPDTVMVNQVVARDGVHDCRPSSNIEVGMGPTAVLCTRGPEAGLVSITARDVPINDPEDGILIVPARTSLAALIREPDQATAGDPNQLSDGDMVFVRFTNQGNPYLTSAGPNDRLRVTPRDEAGLQQNRDFHAMRLVKRGGSAGRAIRSGDLVNLEEDCCGHHRILARGHLLVAAEGTQATDFIIQLHDGRPGAPVLSGSYIYLASRNGNEWLTHEPTGDNEYFPILRVGNPGIDQLLFVRRR